MPLILDSARYRSDHSRLRSSAHAIEGESLRSLQGFAIHSLEEQIAVTLADRTDSKFLLPIHVLPRFLSELSADYTVLEDSGNRIFTYENTYFDTPNWDLYLQHHNGKLNRRKLRFRRYNETDICYLESKLKTNKKRTVKHRIPFENDEHIGVFADDERFEPSLYVNYRRMTFWNHQTDERLTVDYDLHYRRPQGGGMVRLKELFIAELKSERKSYDTSFIQRAKLHGFTPKAFSKYCVGVCLTDDGSLKRNNFKSLLRTVDKTLAQGEMAG